MKKILVLGCSHSLWHHPTWVNILEWHGMQVVNMACPGQGNMQSLYKLYDYATTYGLDNTVVIFQITYLPRFYDYFEDNRFTYKENGLDKIAYPIPGSVTVYNDSGKLAEKINEGCLELQTKAWQYSIKCITEIHGAELICLAPNDNGIIIEQSLATHVLDIPTFGFMQDESKRYPLHTVKQGNNSYRFVRDNTDSHMTIKHHELAADAILERLNCMPISLEMKQHLDKIHAYLSSLNGHLDIDEFKKTISYKFDRIF